MATPNMGLIVPSVGVTTGPTYALNLNADLSTIDAHDHSPGKGAPISTSGLNINSDLSFNTTNNATNLRAVRLTPQLAPLGLSTDLRTLYAVNNDLYYNDGLGNQIALTLGGAVAGTPGSIANLLAPASASYNALNSTFVWQSAANTPANMDFASVNLRNLAANSKRLTLSPPSAMSADYALTLPPLPGATNIVTLDVTGNFTAVLNVDGTTIHRIGNTLSANIAGITGLNDSNMQTGGINSASIGSVSGGVITNTSIAPTKMATVGNTSSFKVSHIENGTVYPSWATIPGLPASVTKNYDATDMVINFQPIDGLNPAYISAVGGAYIRVGLSGRETHDFVTTMSPGTLPISMMNLRIPNLPAGSYNINVYCAVDISGNTFTLSYCSMQIREVLV